jgi:diguanylate cyclase
MYGLIHILIYRFYVIGGISMNKENSIIYLDEKTGLKNYDAFISDFESFITEAIKNCTDLSIAMIDIDDLGSINSKYGISIGDNILISISRYLSDNIPLNAQLYRYSGDQFVVLLPETDKNNAFLIIEKIHAYYSETSELKVREATNIINSTFSAGVACCPEDGTKANQIIRKAQGALLRSKTSGRNKVSLSKTEKLLSRKSLYTTEQLHRLALLSKQLEISEGILLREALDDLLKKYDR